MKTLSIALLLIIPGAIVVAQSTPTPMVAPMPMPRIIAEVSAGSNGAVKGSPFSAEGVSESVQTLADGNRIVRRWTEKLYRSGDGKFRREGTGAPGSALGSYLFGDSAVTILNPVGGFRYTFDTDSRTVRESPYRVAPMLVTGQGLTIGAGQSATIYADQAKAFADKAKTFTDRATAIQKAVTEANADGGQDITPAARENELKARAELQAAVVARPVTLAVPALPAMPGVSGMPGQKWETRTEQLGVQNFEGVDAEGTRTITTIPADAIGNERPIEIIYERWYSKELHMIVFSKHSDPRFGEQTYRLTNINRNEPDPSLFEKPAGYKVVSDARPTTYRLAQPRKATTVPVKSVATTTVTKP